MPIILSNERCLECGSVLICAKSLCNKCYRREWNKRSKAGEETKRPRCEMGGCERYAVIKGQCRQCYGRGRKQVKGKGMIRSNIQTLDNGIAEAQKLYDLVTGLANRMRWRRKIDDLTAQRRTLEEQLNGR